MADRGSVEYQAMVDEEHLRLLSIFYYVTGGVTAVYSLFPIIHVLMGVMVIAMSSIAAAADEEAMVGVIMGGIVVVFGGLVILLGLLTAALKLYAGYCIARRRSRTLCLVAAGISCFAVPYGTVLGALTFAVLFRESVVGLFDTPKKAPCTAATD